MVSLFSICSLVIEKVNAKLWFLIISKISNDNYFITMFEKQRGHTFSRGEEGGSEMFTFLYKVEISTLIF